MIGKGNVSGLPYEKPRGSAFFTHFVGLTHDTVRYRSLQLFTIEPELD
jgi:hypothetical protein